jgi:hypothetical protein
MREQRARGHGWVLTKAVGFEEVRSVMYIAECSRRCPYTYTLLQAIVLLLQLTRFCSPQLLQERSTNVLLTVQSSVCLLHHAVLMLCALSTSPLHEPCLPTPQGLCMYLLPYCGAHNSSQQAQAFC